MRGFTIIEGIVAIAILGVIVVALAGLGHSTALSSVARDQDIALKIASSEIDALRAGGYAALPVSGTFTDPSMSGLTNGSGAIAISTYASTTKRVDVTVSWLGHDTKSHTLMLSTLVTKTGGL